MKRTIWGLGLAAITAVALISACGEPTTSPDGGGTTCSSDSQCGTGKMCHPVSKACIPTCTGATDCPSTAKTCDALAGSTSTSKFCQCSSDALCNGGSAGSLVCSPPTKTCEAKCTAGSCPSGYTCDTATGYCKGGGGNTDGGTDAGTGLGCSWNSCTGAGQVCDLVHGMVCVQQGTCNSANAEPDTCPWAQYCAGDNKCYEPAKATCANFTPPGGMTPKFYTSGDNGPIIYNVDTSTAVDAKGCTPAYNAFTMTLSAYRSDAAWPSSKSALPGFWYVTTTGQKIDATQNVRPSNYHVNGAVATITLTLCSTVTSNLSAGFYFDNGNEYCALAPTGTKGTGP